MTLPIAFVSSCVLVFSGSSNSSTQGQPTPAVQESSSCARCHSNADRATAMRTHDGEPIAPFDLWQSTMMANSTRDPLWRAMVSIEAAANPTRKAEIEAKCLSCHAPMAHQIGIDDHGTGTLMHILNCQTTGGDLARDGVSCTICHGIAPEGLGGSESFSGGYQLNTRRQLFGPHRDPFAMPMQHHTGLTPAYGPHILESALCASCHTLETTALNDRGESLDHVLLEQAPYLEWKNSSYQNETKPAGPLAQSCQDCHFVTRENTGRPIQTRIARNPGGRNFPPTSPREPYGQHSIVGGNTLVLSMFRDHGEELQTQASAEAFQQTLELTREQLNLRTATIDITDVQRKQSRISFQVTVENLAGHKLPTGHPTRRAWLQVAVTNESGDVLFSSGATDERGRIVDQTHTPLPFELAGGPPAPHRATISSDQEVAVYQATMADANGQPTYLLLRGAEWYSDTRLLPKGWSPAGPSADRTKPVGTQSDPNFTGGTDIVAFSTPLPATGPVTIDAKLVYQPLSARWADEILQWDTVEVATFGELYETASPLPEVLAQTSAKVAATY